MKLISLSKYGKNKGKYFAQVDDKNYDYLNQYNWYAQKLPHGIYAARKIWKKNVKEEMEYMHRLIMKTPFGMYTDHINHDTLNNQELNLRICTNTQNCQNMNKKKNTISNYKGIYSTPFGKWMARITKDRETIYIGSFDTENLAAKAYNEKAKDIFGEFANLNKI